MMRTFLAAGLPLAMLAFSGGKTHAMTPQELCDRVFEQYGVQTEECMISDEAPSAPPPPEIDAETRESHVFFSRGGAALDDDARLQLTVLVQVLETPLMSRACLRLIGHSDTSGPAAGNLNISQKRAEAVATEFRAGLKDSTRVQVVSAEGETRPLPGISGSSPLNRRVEIQARDCF